MSNLDLNRKPANLFRSVSRVKKGVRRGGGRREGDRVQTQHTTELTKGNRGQVHTQTITWDMLRQDVM